MFVNCVLDIVFEKWKSNLTYEGLLIEDIFSRLTNTRYADDILIYAKSLEELVYMTTSLIEELRMIGLRLNTEKTKIHIGMCTRGTTIL